MVSVFDSASKFLICCCVTLIVVPLVIIAIAIFMCVKYCRDEKEKKRAKLARFASESEMAQQPIQGEIMDNNP